MQRILGNLSLSKEYALKSITLNPYEHVSYKTLAEINLIQGDYDGFYTNFETFLDKKGRTIDTEDVEDVIYEKIKDEERFDLLIKKTTSNLISNDINISINDSEILSDSVNNKKKTNRIKRAIISILLLIIVIVSLSVNNKQFPKSTIVKKTSVQDADKDKTISNGMIGIYKTFNIDKSKVIINSPKFKVSLNTTNVKVGGIVKVQVDGLNQTAKVNAGQVLIVEKYADSLSSNYATSNYKIEIHNFKTTNNQIKTYVFVQPQEGDDNTYEYDFILTEIK